jgi:diguanylate cyclase (GGDEF)-like protein
MARWFTRTPGLGARLVLVVLGFCLVFTLLTVAVRTWWAWRGNVQAMSAELSVIEQVYRQTLSKGIWELDKESLETHLASAARVPSVGRIVLKVSLAQRPPEILDKAREGWRPSSLAPSRQVALVYQPFQGASENLGELSLFGDERVLWAQLRGEVSAIVITQLIQSLLLAGLLMLAFTRAVTVHVQRIARHLGQLTPANLRQALSLERRRPRQDELQLLVSGVNQLQDTLAEHIEQQQRYETELAQHRDHLADLVRSRTSELEALADAQQLVLTLSNRLIHAPYEQFEATQLGCMQEVARRLQASVALWVVREDGSGKYRPLLSWRAHDGPPPEGRIVDLRELPALLQRDELLCFGSPAALELAAGRFDAKVFRELGLQATAFADLRGGEDHFGFLVFGKPRAVSGWLPDEQALLALTAQMLVHSARHKTQMLDIVQGQQALRAANAQLAELARNDPLTGLANRRHFDEVKEIEFRRTQRLGQPLALLVCDIDNFKRYNDAYGHASGDSCLRAVAQAIKAAVRRAGDLVARIGGEEFVVLLPSTDREAALALADRVIAAVADAAIPHKDSDTASVITVSIGVAVTTTTPAAGFDALFQVADRALYAAKAAGRNRAVLAEEAP